MYETSPEFTDQVMQRLTMAKRPAQSPSTPSEHVVLNFFTRQKQFVHFAVAGAATYLFVATGILQSLVSVDTLRLEIEMKMRVHHVVTTGIEWLTQIIQG
ncbi:hypothetical protein BVG16_24820 [Paenibacillus selenitireducens]|uniref:Uncharacterized protein n=1 Tax=Paenibacillus selenitireducens TaxID=1324314 RepID=A0A1T2X378_9BACL|nr:hypothetical protein [Paenibacillus selenitireducens]OPA74348.1 hypothetical protein BVG16_24820 [Paenibacillus selenitireducens]